MNYITKWDQENPRLKWKNLTNDERVLIRLKSEQSEATLPRCKATLRRIVKQYDSIKRAASYQNHLYNQYDDVKLIDWPRFSENGRYIWEVSSPVSKSAT